MREVILAKSAGFCFGVRKAVELAEEMAESGRPFVMLGPVIHNDAVIKSLEARGVSCVDTVEDVPEGSGVIIRSHFLVPVERIHQVQVDKGPILRKFGLASVTVTTAGGIANLEYLDEPIAEDIAQNLNEKIIKMLKARE